MREGASRYFTYEVAVLQERAEVDEDVLWGAVEESRVRLRAVRRLVCGNGRHRDRQPSHEGAGRNVTSGPRSPVEAVYL